MLETSAETLPIDWEYLEKRAHAEGVLDQIRQIKAECEDDNEGDKRDQGIEVRGNKK
jgi:hypothetical protein